MHCQGYVQRSYIVILFSFLFTQFLYSEKSYWSTIKNLIVTISNAQKFYFVTRNLYDITILLFLIIFSIFCFLLAHYLICYYYILVFCLYLNGDIKIPTNKIYQFSNEVIFSTTVSRVYIDLNHSSLNNIK